jgi:AsmA-like C-terminal region
MADGQSSTRKWLVRVSIVAACAAIGVVTAVYALGPGLRAAVHHRTEIYFRQHFKSSVEISGFHVSVFPRVRVALDGLVLRHEGRTDIPPLLQVNRVTFDAGFFSILRRRPHIRSVQLDGLQIHIPPRENGQHWSLPQTSEDLVQKYPVTIADVHADNAVLVILPRDPGKTPRQFLLHHLELNDVRLDRPADFRAILTNPVPKGEIDASGKFGPWNADDPSITPVNASYKFDDADLGTLRGIKGILSSTGTFRGALNYLNVEGETDVPNFSLRTTHHPVALHTDFTAIVDGTNGNVILTSVVARFLNTMLDVKGEVVDKTPKKGRTILLDAVTSHARVEDLLRLAVDSDKPMMTGAAKLRTQIEIPEGNEDLIEKLRLTGQFDMDDTRFTSPQTEQRLETLSLKGQGKPAEQPSGDVASEFQGKFVVAKGVVTLSDLSFSVTGASVALRGTYGLDDTEMDFRGRLLLDAKLSQTTTGAKSFFLKAVDPFFRGKKAGTDLPIKITGTKDHPAFALDFHDKLNKD